MTARIAVLASGTGSNASALADAIDRGEPTDINESTKIEWLSPDEIRRLLRDGEISDGLSFGALAYALATGVV